MDGTGCSGKAIPTGLTALYVQKIIAHFLIFPNDPGFRHLNKLLTDFTKITLLNENQEKSKH